MLGLGQGGSVGPHSPPGRELRAKCKSWWVKEEKHVEGLSPGAVLLLSSPARESRFLYLEGQSHPRARGRGGLGLWVRNRYETANGQMPAAFSVT